MAETQNEVKVTDTQNELEQDEVQKVIQETEGPLKAMLVNYVGQVIAPEDGQVTVGMIIQTLASEFPEFLLVVARENWLRGYQQALTDVDNAEKERVEKMKSDTERIKAAEEKKIEAKYKKAKKANKKTKNERVSKEA